MCVQIVSAFDQEWLLNNIKGAEKARLASNQQKEQGHYVEIKAAILQSLEESQFQSRKYSKLEQAFLIFLM